MGCVDLTMKEERKFIKHYTGLVFILKLTVSTAIQIRRWVYNIIYYHTKKYAVLIRFGFYPSSLA